MNRRLRRLEGSLPCGCIRGRGDFPGRLCPQHWSVLSLAEQRRRRLERPRDDDDQRP